MFYHVTAVSFKTLFARSDIRAYLLFRGIYFLMKAYNNVYRNDGRICARGGEFNR